MEEYKMVIISILSSAATLLFKAFLDFLQERAKDKRERKQLILQRKTDAAEKAMSWYQEAIDCFSFMQMACGELILGYGSQAYAKYQYAVQKMQKLSAETPKNLNPLYLYFDASQVEQKYDATSSLNRMIFFQNEIAGIGLKIQELIEEGYSVDSEEIEELMNQEKPFLEKLSRELDIQIKSMADIQKTLRKDYAIYSIKADKVSLFKRTKRIFRKND